MTKNDIITKVESQQLSKFPKFSSGDTVEVSVKVKEGKRERVQIFEGFKKSLFRDIRNSSWGNPGATLGVMDLANSSLIWNTLSRMTGVLHFQFSNPCLSPTAKVRVTSPCFHSRELSLSLSMSMPSVC